MCVLMWQGLYPSLILAGRRERSHGLDRPGPGHLWVSGVRGDRVCLQVEDDVIGAVKPGPALRCRPREHAKRLTLCSDQAA